MRNWNIEFIIDFNLTLDIISFYDPLLNLILTATCSALRNSASIQLPLRRRFSGRSGVLSASAGTWRCSSRSITTARGAYRSTSSTRSSRSSSEPRSRRSTHGSGNTIRWRFRNRSEILTRATALSLRAKRASRTTNPAEGRVKLSLHQRLRRS